jgi:hypothetical protein
MQMLTCDQVDQVSGSLRAVDLLLFGETMAAGAMGGIVGVVSSAFLSPAGGIAVGWGVGVAVSYGFHEINGLIGIQD